MKLLLWVILYVIIAISLFIANKNYWNNYYSIYPEEEELNTKEQILYLKKKEANKKYRKKMKNKKRGSQ